MKKITIIGGGAAGMACAAMLARAGKEVALLERGDRLGRKLSATGNGQGNVTNVNIDASHYFSDDEPKLARILSRFSWQDAVNYLQSMGGLFLPDARGRVYPAGRQASAVTDLFRRELALRGVNVLTGVRVTRIEREKNSLCVYGEGKKITSEIVVLAAGGAAAKNFGTDGSAYELARAFGHTVTPLQPVLVQLRCAPESVRGLKGIRMDAGVRVLRGREQIYSCRGDVLFTESGVSGDAVFRASSYAQKGDVLQLDFLPDVDETQLRRVVGEGEEGLWCVVPNGLGRFLYKKAEGDRERSLTLLKQFELTVSGTLGFDYAQATRGGVLLSETDEHLQSNKCKGLYFAGEILNVDGECGGYNLHWAFASAHAVAEALI